MQTAFDEYTEYTTVQRYLFPSTPSPQLQVSVIVPVRNEAHHLWKTLDALRQQQDTDGFQIAPTTYEVLLLINNCSDRSYEVAVQYQRRYPAFSLHIAYVQLPPAQANIGTVRRLLMDEAYRRLTLVNCPTGIIASTDGDTVADSQWLYYIRHEIAQGNDAVGGRILTHPEQSPVRLYHLRDVMYRSLIARVEAVLDPALHDPWPRHFQHFGASIAVTCQMYERVGRLPQKPFLEDEAFYQALMRMDARVRKSPHVKVITSTRLQGRVAVGFSEQLRYWSRMHEDKRCQVVEPAEAIMDRFRARQELRLHWQSGKQLITHEAIRTLANQFQADPQWLYRQVQACDYFGQLWERVNEAMTMGEWGHQWQPVPITTAIQRLREFLKSW
jgi:glycosyltransferase involved in cell wall biosynthesis